MAIRIEDSQIEEIQLGKKDWKAGKLIHNMRINLMKQHLGDSEISSGWFFLSNNHSIDFFFLIFDFLNVDR